ncbi:TetR family transcriptional regulator [Inquilinus limosus MP06]|uniref:TetR family transcriptional regulator n=1 Tax=Inquilinus limosus MP06 TaxID=1398085 RepID=A0A0A0D6B7_9PROT|nr:TetR family transcriptional regulator [Inquilinus limosus MP06]
MRETILATAMELFYREGVRAVGVDTVVAASGVAKTSLYRWFPSKDHLIAAVVAEQDRLFWEWWGRVEARHPGAPREQLRALLAGVVKRLRHPAFRGCPFLNLAAELPDADHPGRRICRDNKRELRCRLAALAESFGAREPQRLADQLGLLINGANAGWQVMGEEGGQDELIAAAEVLVEAQLRPG